MEKQDYTMAKDGWIDGRYHNAGTVLNMTQASAEAWVREGALVPVQKPSKTATDPASKKG